MPEIFGVDHLWWQLCSTLPETNIAHENGWLEDEFPFGMAYFQGLLLLVSGSVIFQLGWPTSHWIQEWDDVPDGKPGNEADGFSPELGQPSAKPVGLADPNNLR